MEEINVLAGKTHLTAKGSEFRVFVRRKGVRLKCYEQRRGTGKKEQAWNDLSPQYEMGN